MTAHELRKEIKALQEIVDSLWAVSDRLKEEIKADPDTKLKKTAEILNNHEHIQGIDHQIYYLKQELKAITEEQ